MGRRLLVAAVAVAAVGMTAPSASAKCSPDADPVTCFWMCTTARLVGAACKS
ncbi:MAG TPA: hypothetical protein VGX28_14830 [Frankiaceae bacterium]|jgi:hypothetical protein|nr:hypothetical protein [Frankiaceae bacterium]